VVRDSLLNILRPGTEECDDGDLNPGDGCNEVCQPEICGDGKVDVNEMCDDGNTIDGDGCTSSCESEAC